MRLIVILETETVSPHKFFFIGSHAALCRSLNLWLIITYQNKLIIYHRFKFFIIIYVGLVELNACLISDVWYMGGESEKYSVFLIELYHKLGMYPTIASLVGTFEP